LNSIDADSFSEAGRRGVRITEITTTEEVDLLQVDGKDVDEAEDCEYCGQICGGKCDEAQAGGFGSDSTS
jgi:hypothetical protein